MMDDDVDGEEKLIAAVRHIAKSLGRTQTMADDILQVFSSFDSRFFALEKTASDGQQRCQLDAPIDGHGSSTSARPPLADFDRNLRALERQILRFVDFNRLIWSDSADAAAFLEAVDGLLDTATDLNEHASPAAKPLLDRADLLLRRCVLRLDEEFRSIGGPTEPAILQDYEHDGHPYHDSGELDEQIIPVANPVNGYDIIIDSLPPGAVADLNDIARRMAAAGFGRECCETYAGFRRSFFDESVARLGLLPPPSDGFLASPWEDMEQEIPRWIEAARLMFLILIPSERRLCDRVFASMPAYADLAFSISCVPAAADLISFAAAVASGDQGPERLFGLLDLYEAVRDLLPELDSVLTDRYSAEVLAEVGAVHKALAASIRRIFVELENRIRRDPAKAAVPGGDVHPITRYVMNYLVAACSRPTLAEVMAEDASRAGAGVPLPVRVAWIADILLDNLDAKSKIYRDTSLSYIFLMNNGRYVLLKATGNEVGNLLGEDWNRRLSSKVKQWAGEYQRCAWNKVMAALRTEGFSGAASTSSVATEKAIRDKLGMFNNYLEDIWKTQGNWVAVDDQMRDELRAAVAEAVVPAYRNLVARLRQAGDARWLVGRYLKYSVEDVEARINELFEGGRRRPQ
ncbi:exocyst complex component EXO70B1 [Canna indica]|uniref:Exocyst subunit Exo70 family protein n=1 Tax=Canna indica TaxID=4628 RepID=A0AAQ3KCP5_9LILI|nr:exocyst complex component EXO70B1 [Canna indica]